MMKSWPNLKALESSMAAVSAHISGLKEIAEALTPNSGLSDLGCLKTHFWTHFILLGFWTCQY